MPEDIIVAGYVCSDHTYSRKELKEGEIGTGSKIEYSVGGVLGNTGSALVNLGDCVSLVGRIGKDEEGAAIRHGLAKLNTRVYLVEDPSHPSSVSIIEIDPVSKDRTITHECGANKGTLEDDIPLKILSSSRHVHLGYFGLDMGDMSIRRVFRRIKDYAESHLQHEITTSFDTHGSPTPKDQKDFESHSKETDLLIPSYDEIKSILGIDHPKLICEYLLSLGPEVAGVKLGGDGAVLMNNQEFLYAPCYKGQVRSKLGAGDSFYAGAISAFTKGLPLEKILLTASATATLRVTGQQINPENVQDLVENGEFLPPTNKWRFD
jgi:sugar/nucleoside kinase (ribokinase family)